ncbi:MAG: hypothetical protein WBC52_03935, partial [Candidatus Omnitrophota bacterium]
MITLTKLKIIKVIAIVVSISMLWQGVVWANPDIFKRNNLQTQSLITNPEKIDSFLMVATGYLGYFLNNLELDPKNRNVPMMLKGVNEVIEQLAGNEKIDREYREAAERIMRDLRDSSISGEFVINTGAYKVRYFNPNIHDPDPGMTYQVSDEKKIGKYLARQILIQKSLQAPVEPVAQQPEEDVFYQGEGQIARVGPESEDDVNEFFRNILGQRPHRKKSRLSNYSERTRIAGLLSKKVNGSRLSHKRKERIYTAIKRFKEAKVIEIDAVALADENNIKKARAWILSFNTMVWSPNSNKNVSLNPLMDLLERTFPRTIAFSTQVLDKVQSDESLLLEYVFHEVVCHLFGHEEARKIQEVLFSENYRDVEGDTLEGHKDGKLAHILKKVINSAIKVYKKKRKIKTKIEKQKASRIKKPWIFNWKRFFKSMAITTSVALVLSALFYLTLPVNTVTIAIAIGLPIALMIYLIARDPSLGNIARILLTIAAFTVIFYFLPAIPWFGLSVSVIVVARLISNRKAGSSAKGRVAGGGEAPSEVKGKEIKDKGAKSQEAAGEGKGAEAGTGAQGTEEEIPAQDNGKIFKDNEISPDILKKILGILGLTEEKKDKKDKQGEKETPEMSPTEMFLRMLFKPENVEGYKRAEEEKEPEIILEVPEVPELKEKLRPIVVGRLEKIEQRTEFVYELYYPVDVFVQFRSWKEKSSEELGQALNKISQEIARGLLSDYPERAHREMLAIYEIIAEYFGMPVKDVLGIRPYAAIAQRKEAIESQKYAISAMGGVPKYGRAHPGVYYNQAIEELCAGNYLSAEKLFATAVTTKIPGTSDVMDNENYKLYMLGVGVSRHFLAKWDRKKWKGITPAYNVAYNVHHMDLENFKHKQKMDYPVYGKKVTDGRIAETECRMHLCKFLQELSEKKILLQGEEPVKDEKPGSMGKGYKGFMSESVEGDKLQVKATNKETKRTESFVFDVSSRVPIDEGKRKEIIDTADIKQRSLAGKILGLFPEDFHLYAFTNLEKGIYGFSLKAN